MASQIIDDGYTLDGFIAPVEGIHGGLTFTYRPMTRRALARMETKIRKAKDDDDAEVVAAGVMAEHLTKWDATNSKDEPCKITPDNLLNMQTLLSVSLFNIIRGHRASDDKPQVDPAKNS